MRIRASLPIALTIALCACGGGGGSGSGAPPSQPPAVREDRVVLTYTAPSQAAPAGTTPLVEFIVTNPSTSVARDVALTFTFGPGVTGSTVLCTPTAEAICPAFDSTTVTTLAARSALKYSVYRLVSAGSTGAIPVTASVTSSNDEVTTNNSAQFSYNVYSADVGISVASGVSDASPGDTVPFTVTVSNAGPDAAQNVQLDRLMGGRQNLLSMTCAASGGATCPTNLAAQMQVPTLPSGGSLAFNLSTQIALDALGSVSTSMRAQTLGDLGYGNNNASGSTYVSVPAAANSPTFTRFTSDIGDPVGRGLDYSYDRLNSVYELQDYGYYFSLKIEGNEDWTASFFKPAGMTRWQAGIYIDNLGAPFHDPITGGVQVSGPGSGCPHNGWFRISNVEYTGDVLTAIDIVLAQHCDNRAPALRGQIHWVANDGTRPPGPVNPPPTSLWDAAAGTTPASGNYLYLESEAGETILQGSTLTFTQANSTMGASDNRGGVNVSARTTTSYDVGFQAMSPLTEMEPGYYEIDPTKPIWNPVYPTMYASADGRSCSQAVGGWFVIDSVSHFNGELTGLDARFLLRCGNTTAALRGKIHWRSDDTTQPTGPQNPPPAGLWTPPNTLPASGNVVYLETFLGTGPGPALTFTPLDSIITVNNGGSVFGNLLRMNVGGDSEWTANFQAMSSLPDLRAGYYGNLGIYPGHDGTVGGMYVQRSASSTCASPGGWFVVDSITYTGSEISAVELRFEQPCPGTVPIRGYIRWSAADTRQPSPPQNPPPANLWQPEAGKTPAGINYVYLVREPAGQPVQEDLYTQVNSEFVLQSAWRNLEFHVRGDRYWRGAFMPMPPFDELQPGYYDLTNSSSNPAKGSFGWSGDDQICNGATGWFVVDAVTYQAGVIRAIDARFERRCLSGAPNMHGKIRWRFDDSTAAPGPLPIPSNLWQPPAGAFPPTGNVFYVVGEPLNWLLDNDYRLIIPPAYFQGGTGIDNFYVGAQGAGNNSGSVHLKPMNSLPRLQVGYYPNATPTAQGNPTRGRFDASIIGSGCGQDEHGWFVVDSVTYNGDQMTSLQMRYESRCPPSDGAVMHGFVRWAQ